MDKYEFIQYTAKRYGISEDMAETMVDMFAESLQEVIASGTNLYIDEIGEFKSTPLFPNGLNHHNNIALAKAAKLNMVSFKASKHLIKTVA